MDEEVGESLRFRSCIIDHTLQQVKILLLEDNPEHQDLLKRFLTASRPFVSVDVVPTGSDFICAIAARQYDCAILDYNLPDTKADELLVRCRDGLLSCPAIVVSSDEQQQVVIDSIRSGSVDFVPKMQAFERNVLWSRVQNAVLKARKTRRVANLIERRHSTLAKLAETDPLTSLNNRRYLDRLLSQKHFIDDRRKWMSCILMDVDHFKNVNDTYGHAVGDVVLKGIASHLSQLSAAADILLRWGGEEFLILKSSTDLSQAWSWAEKFRVTLSQKIFIPNRPDFRVTVSQGIVTFPTAQISIDYIDQADRAMYRAKQTGRDRICTAEMITIDRLLQNIDTDNDLEYNWNCFIELMRQWLGPTQLEHVTQHGYHVEKITQLLLTDAALTQAETSKIHLAARMHDLGKAFVPEHILNQSDKLTEPQWRLISHHPHVGADISRKLGADDYIVDCILSYHLPYENGRNQLSYPAQAVAVADALAAMTSPRSYRPSRSLFEAIEELKRESGYQFNPEIVQTAQNLIPQLADIIPLN